MQVNVRADRGTVVHAAHEGHRRPLCRPIERKLGDPWYNPSFEAVTCRRCLKMLGKPAPELKRMSAKAAVNKVLRDLGLRPKLDFSTHDHLLSKDQSGGFRIVQYTTVTVFGDEPKKLVMDNAEAIIKALWTNRLGRHNFSMWVNTLPKGTLWLQLDTDEVHSMYREKDPAYRRLASCHDLPDRNLHWGEEPADETTEKEPETMTADVDLIAVVRCDDATASRSVFTKMVADHGRNEASTRWAAATATVAAEDPMNPPSMVAPDCDMACGESYLDPGCNPCVTLESIRHPKVEVKPFECGCGTVIDGRDDAAILDHFDACDQAGT